MYIFRIAAVVTVLCIAQMGNSLSAAVITDTYGSATPVNTGPASNTSVMELTSKTAVDPGFAGMYMQFTTPFQLKDLAMLMIDYLMVEGEFGGGSPRFTIFDTGSGAAYVYLGTPQPDGTFVDPNSAWASTGNLVASADKRVESNGFGGFNSGYPPITFADFVTAEGDTYITFVALDLDGGWLVDQKVFADNLRVNNYIFSVTEVDVPEPGTFLLFGAGLMTFMFLRRTRREAT